MLVQVERSVPSRSFRLDNLVQAWRNHPRLRPRLGTAQDAGSGPDLITELSTLETARMIGFGIAGR